MEENVEIVKPNHSQHPKKTQDNNLIYKIILGVILLFIVAGASFAGGITYQKDHGSKSTTASTTSASGFNRFGGGGFSRSDRSFGTVTAVSASSITVQPNFGSTTPKTFTINSSTAITNNGQTVAVSSITVGETVIVTASTSDSSVAASILVNPSFGGGGNSGSDTNGGSDTSGQPEESL